MLQAGPLSTIQQRSWEPGEVSAAWKLASVIPIHKKGMGEGPGNYRPVSLTPVLRKVMQKSVRGGDTERHLKNKAMTRHSQHGFAMGKSCLSHLSPSTIRSPTRWVRGRQAADVILLDCSEAFSPGPHSIFLSKLSNCEHLWQREEAQRQPRCSLLRRGSTGGGAGLRS